MTIEYTSQYVNPEHEERSRYTLRHVGGSPVGFTRFGMFAENGNYLGCEIIRLANTDSGEASKVVDYLTRLPLSLREDDKPASRSFWTFVLLRSDIAAALTLYPTRPIYLYSERHGQYANECVPCHLHRLSLLHGVEAATAAAQAMKEEPLLMVEGIQGWSGPSQSSEVIAWARERGWEESPNPFGGDARVKELALCQ